MAPGGADPSLLTVVIPARNEAATIADVVRGASRYAAVVLVVDGMSTDGTAEAAAGAGAQVLLQRGLGKGLAVRLSVPQVGTDIVVLMDADGSHDPEDIPRLVAPIARGEADHVTGSRLLGGSSELHGGFDEWLRLSGSSFITACINCRYRVRLSDSQNGFRALRTSLLRRLPLRSTGFTIEQEMIVETLRAGQRMGEVPSHEHPRRAGRSHLSVWRHGWRYPLSLLRLML